MKNKLTPYYGSFGYKSINSFRREATFLDRGPISGLVGLSTMTRWSSSTYASNFIKVTLFFSASDEEQKVLKGLPLKKEDVLIFICSIIVFVCLFIVSVFSSFVFLLQSKRFYFFSYTKFYKLLINKFIYFHF